MNMIDYLEKTSIRYPEKTAFQDSEKSITYGELWKQAEGTAAMLIRTFSRINEPVAVIIDRNVESICAFMGIAMSRNFYVPIDGDQPAARIHTILEQMQPFAVITAKPLPDGVQVPDGISVIPYGALYADEAGKELIETVRKTAMDTDPLYAICTSGSTGTPKGVLISHRSVMDFIPVFVKTFDLSENEIFGNQAPFDFDVSVKDIYSTLYCGATMYIIPKVCFSMPKKLMDVLDEQKITTIIWAVSALCIVAGVNAFKYKIPLMLRKIMFSGEVMPVKMLNIWRAYLPEAVYVNLYGPTEITCNCMYYIIDREFEVTEKLPLGIPFENEGVFFLNEDNRPIKKGETGEICVTGTCLALGYYRNPETTRSVFVQNPLNQRYPEKMYRTGDLATLSENGEYYFAARKDFQIKHMGHRIELEEIEKHINAIPGVIRCVCIFDSERNKIIAFYTGDTDKTEIISGLKKYLPKYMIPNVYQKMESLPITKNGKIDRQALKKQCSEMG